MAYSPSIYVAVGACFGNKRFCHSRKRESYTMIDLRFLPGIRKTPSRLGRHSLSNKNVLVTTIEGQLHYPFPSRESTLLN